ncbi:hypothetical protein WJX72_011336 [[Myrmecia] bisecta]|uniref:BZIP domain-containing protein n=1 Tax=[Myrmecia] bisecta TaxID=41462 RepID=A0AAW1QSV0_9CHLO
MPALFEGQAYLTTSTAFAAAGSTGPSAFPVGAPGFPTARSAGQAAYNPAGSATFNGAGSAGQSAFAAAGSAPQTAFNRSGLAAFNPAGSAGQPAFVAAGIGFGVPLAAGSAFPTPFMQPDYTLLPSNPQQPASAAAALAASVGFLVPPVKLEVKPSSGSSALSAGQSGPPPSGGLDPNSEDDVSQGAPPQGELWTNAESLTEREPEASGSAGPEQLTLSDLRNLKARGSIRSSQMCQEALKSLETTNALVQAAKDAFAPQVPGGTSQASGRSTRSGSAGTKRQMAAEKAAAEKVAADQRRMGRPVAYEGDPDSSQLTAEERRRIRRRINNRESARRVREKRQEIMDRITEQMRALEGDKAKLVKYVGEVEDTCRAMTDEMRRVKERWCQSCIENVKLYKEVFELRKRLQAVTGEPQGNLLEVSAAPQMPTGTDSPFAQPTASLANLRPPQLSSVESINLDEWLKVEFSGA